MNVISYEIEIKRSKFFGFDISDKKKTVSDLLQDSFTNELELSKADLPESLRNEWTNIVHSELKAIYNNINCRGYSTTENLKLFLFEKENSNTRSKNNISLDVIAFGNLEANKILNYSYIKINDIIDKKSLSCKYIDGAQVLIYPFNTQGNDIYSYELKVKSELVSRFEITKKIYSRWIIMLIGFLVAIIYKGNATTTTSNSANESNNGVLDSVIASFVFYLVVEIVVYFVIPFFTEKNKKYLRIRNLTSFVESGTNGKKTTSENNSYQTPNV